MDLFNNLAHPILNQIFNLPVFPNGKHTITLGMTLHLMVLIALLFYATNFAKKSAIEPLLAKTTIDVAVRGALGSLFSYAVLSVGMLIILDTAGIDISAITVLAGALGLGISLSLQGIISNFMSGLILLLERPVRIGDRVEVSAVAGDIIDISLRTTTVLTPDNVTVIIPNSEFISSKVFNWSHSSRSMRVQLPVVVDKNIDPDVLRDMVLAIAANHSAVRAKPSPELLFRSLGETSQTFVLSIWTDEYAHKPELLQSDINFAISRALRNGHLPDVIEKHTERGNDTECVEDHHRLKPTRLWQSLLQVGNHSSASQR